MNTDEQQGRNSRNTSRGSKPEKTGANEFDVRIVELERERIKEVATNEHDVQHEQIKLEQAQLQEEVRRILGISQIESTERMHAAATNASVKKFIVGVTTLGIVYVFKIYMDSNVTKHRTKYGQ